MTEPSPNAPSPTPIAPTASTAGAFAVQRLNMVDSQVRPSDITDRRILRAMGTVPREDFLPAALKSIAYMDNPIILDRTSQPRVLLEPRLFAKLIQLAEIPDGGRVLEIGCGTGYGLAVLSAMGCKAFGLDENAVMCDLARQSNATIAAQIKTGPLPAGLAVEGPFDAIIFAGSIPAIPHGLFDQLKNGARLVAVTGAPPASKATVWVRSGMRHAARDAFDATAAPLPGFSQPAQFVF